VARIPANIDKLPKWRPSVRKALSQKTAAARIGERRLGILRHRWPGCGPTEFCTEAIETLSRYFPDSTSSIRPKQLSLAFNEMMRAMVGLPFLANIL
jgi:hypothetical protein